MRITVGLPDGEIIIEAGEGEAQAAVDLIQTLQGRPGRHHDPAALTRLQRETYEVLAEHPEDGCHYSTVAARLGIGRAMAAARCNALRNLGYAERLRAGVYRLTGKE